MNLNCYLVQPNGNCFLIRNLFKKEKEKDKFLSTIDKIIPVFIALTQGTVRITLCREELKRKSRVKE